MHFILMQHMYTVTEQINGALRVYLYLIQNTYVTFLLILCVAVAEFRWVEVLLLGIVRAYSLTKLFSVL